MSQAKDTFMADREKEANGLPIIYAGMSKTDISIAAKSAVDNLLENGNALQVAEQIAAMENFLKEVKGDDRYTSYIRDEVAKYGKTYTAASGAKIELAETGTKYDFSVCNDPVLKEFEEKCSQLEEGIKARKEFLKNVPESGMNIITEDGEAVTIYRPAKSSTSSFKITLKK